MKKIKYKKIDNDNIEQITTRETEEVITLHIPDLENKLQRAKDEVVRLEKLLEKIKKLK